MEQQLHMITSEMNSFSQSNLIATKVGHFSDFPEHYTNRKNGLPEYILIFCLSGKGWVKSKRINYVVKSGDCILIPENFSHSYGSDSDNPWDIYWVHFQCSEEQYPLSQPLHKLQDIAIYHPKVSSLIEQPLIKITQLAFHTSVNHFVTAEITGYLFILLSRLFQSNQDASVFFSDPLTKTCLTLLQDNIYAQLTLDNIAEQLNISKYYLVHRFRKMCGQTPMYYYNHLKCQEACRLLTTTTKTISQISDLLCYSTPYYFSERFKTFTGYSPRHYRTTYSEVKGKLNDKIIIDK